MSSRRPDTSYQLEEGDHNTHTVTSVGLCIYMYCMCCVVGPPGMSESCHACTCTYMYLSSCMYLHVHVDCKFWTSYQERRYISRDSGPHYSGHPDAIQDTPTLIRTP